MSSPVHVDGDGHAGGNCFLRCALSARLPVVSGEAGTAPRPTRTNVTAQSVRTIDWLSAPTTCIAVPVFQRQYRWNVETSRRLLEDIRRIADAGPQETHFLGSILLTSASADRVEELTLIDGQQRVATLTLLIAALRHTVQDSQPALAAQLDLMLLHPADPSRIKLRPHDTQERILSSIVFGRDLVPEDMEASHYDENFDYFLQEVGSDPDRVWVGLQRLEHVVVTITERANPQQIFESLNSVGAPLHNYELIHNYVLMGLSRSEQSEIEQDFWMPIEANVGELQMDAFLRDYLILHTGQDSNMAGERGLYDAFRAAFRALSSTTLKDYASEWKAYSEIYRLLLDPTHVEDPEIARQFRFVGTFGAQMYPLIMGVYQDHREGKIDQPTLIETLERLQTLYLRKMIAGESRDQLAAQLCRSWRKYGYPIRALVRRAPSDETVRRRLKTRPLPHAVYVLGRLQNPPSLEELQIEHIFPQSPGAAWTGGNGEWGSFSEADRALYRDLSETLGNLILLEGPLNAGAGNRSFADKKPHYLKSKVPGVPELAGNPTWDVDAITRRTEQLTDKCLQIWTRSPGVESEDEHEHLVPILDVQRKPGFYPGWKTEYEYVEFCGDRWEIRNNRELAIRVFEHLWQTDGPGVREYAATHESPVGQNHESHYRRLGEGYYLNPLWIPQYHLWAVQEVLDMLGIAEQVLVKFSTEED